MKVSDRLIQLSKQQKANPNVNAILAAQAGVTSDKPLINTDPNTKNRLLKALQMLGVVGTGQPRDPAVNMAYEKYKAGTQLTPQEAKLINNKALDQSIGLVGSIAPGGSERGFYNKALMNDIKRKGGMTAPVDLLISHEGAPDLNRVKFYEDMISKGKFPEPLKVINEGLKYGIEDGKHRFQAFKNLGFKQVPIDLVEARKLRR